MSISHAKSLITGSPIAREFASMGAIPERAIREIAKVEPARRQEAFTRPTESAQGVVPTAREI